MDERRKGDPLSEEERKRRHLAIYGTEEVPERGAGLEYPEPEKASEIHSDDGHQIGMVTLWSDGKVTVCASEPGEKEGACYTSSKPEGKTLYYMALAWFSGMGHEVHDVEAK